MALILVPLNLRGPAVQLFVPVTNPVRVGCLGVQLLSQKRCSFFACDIYFLPCFVYADCFK